MSPIQYLAAETAPLFLDSTGTKKRIELLWGDRLETFESASGRTRVRTRGRSLTGWVASSALGPDRLLEVYIIDVGQGDGILIVTPDGRHVMVDGGYNRDKQPTGKNAADFVDWKFFDDYGVNTIALDAMIASHCDADHYGGLWDLLNTAATAELDCSAVTVGAFYHAGIGWFEKPGGGRWLGPKADGLRSQLVGDRAAVGAALAAGANPRLQGEWRQFLTAVHATGCPIERLSHLTDWLPGFAPAPGQAAIRVLGPVELVGAGGAPALRSYGADSQDTNGNSALLRLDYGRARILLTGDLNQNSQQALLEDYLGERQELAADVAKGCHHGSDDCSYEFLSVVGAASTVISSGDNESHSHPRPTIVAASGHVGHTKIDADKMATPLVYATEIARSVRLGRPTKVRGIRALPDGTSETVEFEPSRVEIDFEEQRAGDLNPTKSTKLLSRMQVVPGILYGLVNIRTDGNKILCATRNENDASWEIETFDSRF